MPAAAVIPALLLNQTTVAVKKFVVAFDMHMCLYNLLYFHMCMYECAPTIHVCVLLSLLLELLWLNQSAQDNLYRLNGHPRDNTSVLH